MSGPSLKQNMVKNEWTYHFVNFAKLEIETTFSV
jgi:hypothetical protein